MPRGRKPKESELSATSTSRRQDSVWDEHREQILEWLSADYPIVLIARWTREQGWPIHEQTIQNYKREFRPLIDRVREERLRDAVERGMAQKAERIKRLIDHADKLEPLKFEYNERTKKYYNPQACREWRETLEDIAMELGDRDKAASLALEREIQLFLDKLLVALDRETYARVLSIASSNGTAAE